MNIRWLSSENIIAYKWHVCYTHLTKKNRRVSYFVFCKQIYVVAPINV